MPGIKGMHHHKPRAKAARRMMWRSMRILGTFTIPDLLRTCPGTEYHNARRFMWDLARHGIVAKVGKYVSGRAGELQQYRLVRLNKSPEYPTVCDRCGQILSAKDCKTKEEREKDKEREKEKEKEKETLPPEVTHDAA